MYVTIVHGCVNTSIWTKKAATLAMSRRCTHGVSDPMAMTIAECGGWVQGKGAGCGAGEGNRVWCRGRVQGVVRVAGNGARCGVRGGGGAPAPGRRLDRPDHSFYYPDIRMNTLPAPAVFARLAALSDAPRARLLACLERHELTVGELQDV